MCADICIDWISIRDREDVYTLVERGFSEFVEDDCTEEGADMFFKAVRYILFEHPENYVVAVAKEGDAAVGMIAVFEHHHISLFFVDRAHQGKHIGRRLFETVLERCLEVDSQLTALDVHSSLFAVPIYERLGFVRRSAVEQQNGIHFVKLEYPVRRLPGRGSPG